jgi:hypothetical protein
MQQVEMAEGMHDFLICRYFKGFGDFVIASFMYSFCKILIFDMHHRFVNERRFEILNAD